MNEEDAKLLSWVQFVTDKFVVNHEPWVYSRDTSKLKHIRYHRDTTGHFHWKKRLRRFFREIFVRHWRSTSRALFDSPNAGKGIWEKIKIWPMMVRVHWNVHMVPDPNRPDGMVNRNIITDWEEDGEYITLFCPYVGREVLKFLQDEPGNIYAMKILQAMRETAERSWPSEKEEDNEHNHSD